MKLKSLAPLLCVWTAMSPGFAQDTTSTEVEKLKVLLSEQQRQIETLRQAVAEQQKAIDRLSKPSTQNAGSLPPAPAYPRPLVASSTPMAVPGSNAAATPKFA